LCWIVAELGGAAGSAFGVADGAEVVAVVLGVSVPVTVGSVLDETAPVSTLAAPSFSVGSLEQPARADSAKAEVQANRFSLRATSACDSAGTR
jgi:hypothetical protein